MALQLFLSREPNIFPQLLHHLNRNRTADIGLDVSQASAQLGALVSVQEVNRFNTDGKSCRVIPMVEDSARYDPAALLDLQLTTPGGELVPCGRSQPLIVSPSR